MYLGCQNSEPCKNLNFTSYCATDKFTTFNPGENQPVRIDFESILTFKDGTTTLPSANDMFSLMSNADYMEYITQYVSCCRHKTRVVWPKADNIDILLLLDAPLLLQVWTPEQNTYFDSVQLASFTGIP